MKESESGLSGLDDESLTVLDRLARSLRVKEAGLGPTLDAILQHAVTTVGGADDAGLILLSGGSLVPQAVTGEPPRALDELQQRSGEGPCVEAAARQQTIYIPDVANDQRWPEFSVVAHRLNVAAMLCVPMRVDDRCLGTLSLFSRTANVFSDHANIATLYATLAALALADAQRTDQLRSALDNRDLIGQAKGILMERQRINAETAFALLATASQDRNLKLTEVAARLVESGEWLVRT